MHQDKLEFLRAQPPAGGIRDAYTSPVVNTFPCNVCVQFSKRREGLYLLKLSPWLLMAPQIEESHRAGEEVGVCAHEKDRAD